jgi:ribose transport system ATP-binding protein
MLDEIFPETGIEVAAQLDSLSIAQMQMVEIARAFSDRKLRLLILDEPTSSLPAEQTEQLRQAIRKKAGEGISFIYISHRLKEVMALVDRIYIAQNGRLQWMGGVNETSEDNLVMQMGGEISQSDERPRHIDPDGRVKNPEIFIDAAGFKVKKGAPVNMKITGGEIVGIAGLEGNGQRDLLHKIFALRDKRDKSLKIKGKMAYVTGDRKKEGNLPLWSILENMMITKLSFGKLSAVTSDKALMQDAGAWYDRLKIKSEGYHAGITSLSGGNQQKVLIARALVADADIILLDDPTRGVDVSTKRQLYEIFDEAARAGKLVVWYSSDDGEFEICNRVFVMRYDTVVGELVSNEISKVSIVGASFQGEELKQSFGGKPFLGGGNPPVKKVFSSSMTVPCIAMVLVYVLCGLLSNNVFTAFGVELLLSGAAPLIFLTVGQMFIIGLGHIDLGIGAFMGLINVISATVLTENPLLGWMVMIGLVALYGCMGLIVYYRNIPAIIMTLGASFVWLGVAITLLPAPGVAAPEWLSAYSGRSSLFLRYS